MDNDNSNQKNPSRRGLASADPDTRRRVASQGGKAAQASGNAHRLTDEERRRGGRQSQGNFAKRPEEEVREIARRGGIASHSNTNTTQNQQPNRDTDDQTPNQDNAINPVRQE